MLTRWTALLCERKMFPGNLFCISGVLCCNFERDCKVCTISETFFFFLQCDVKCRLMLFLDDKDSSDCDYVDVDDMIISGVPFFGSNLAQRKGNHAFIDEIELQLNAHSQPHPLKKAPI